MFITGFNHQLNVQPRFRIGSDKFSYVQYIFFFLENLLRVQMYSLEGPRRGFSNEYPQHVFMDMGHLKKNESKV